MENGIILTLAYPETIVSHADEWYSKFLRFVGIGSKYHVKAGHAALVLINRETGILEYHDFGRYITPEPDGRVRGRDTDHELEFPMKAVFSGKRIDNLYDIFNFLATKPKITHGEGTLYASVCMAINYENARAHIDVMQQRGFMRYAAFINDACNCARFVTDAVIAGLTDKSIKKKLVKSKKFTPSTIGNVVLADSENYVYKISEEGTVEDFKSSVFKENWKLFTDGLKSYQPSIVGTIEPKYNQEKADHAQWLGGIAAGAWFELYDLKSDTEYRFRRISPDGHVDVDATYKIDQDGFDIHQPYQFVHYSNCKFFHIEQNGLTFRFEIIKK